MRFIIFMITLFFITQVQAGFNIMPSDDLHEVDIVQTDYQAESIEMSQADLLFDYSPETMVATIDKTYRLNDAEKSRFVGYGLVAKTIRLSILNRESGFRQFYLLE